MKKSPNHNIYTKLLYFITIMTVFFMLLFLSLYIFNNRQEKQTYQNSQKQFNTEVQSVLKLNSDGPTALLTDLTFWEGLGNFTISKDKNWFKKNIVDNFKHYDFELIEVYGSDNNPIINNEYSKIKSKVIIPKEALEQLNKKGFATFYIKSQKGIIEIFGTKIQSVNNLNSKNYGYFLVGRLLDKDYIQTLETNSNSKIKIVESNTIESNDRNNMSYIFPLKNWNNETISNLTFTRTLNLEYNNTQNLLTIIVLSFVLFILIFIYYCRLWFFAPLNTVTEILETGNKKSIDVLKKAPGEFAHIGNLFEENRNQKLELVKAKLKAEENDRLKTSFLSNLSHEIRTPMNAIVGFTELMMNTKVKEQEQNEYLNIIDKSGKNLISIIDDLIEMSKIDSHQITPNLTSVNIESCINELYDTIKVTIKKSKKIDFFTLENKSPAHFNISTDEVKLKQIIVNLVTNAIKFTHEGYVAFGYEVIEDQQQIKFTVKDTGFGIDEDSHQHIFDRFRRVGDDKSIKAGGLGLGLAISKAYVEMLGGTIALESKIGKGSVFSFTIPLVYDKVEMITVQPIKNKTNIKGEEEGTILIAEDDNINFLLFQKIMKTKNFKIIRAQNGQEAVNICLNNPEIDLVLMDIKMPVMDGFEAFEKIHPIRPNLAVIAQTAFSSNEDKERILKEGFSDYITKPINREKLFDLIDNVFKKKVT
jgi:signal transduction histidine kinase/ActR/RegA family two-component response regulator